VFGGTGTACGWAVKDMVVIVISPQFQGLPLVTDGG
jgi:hypothetical protein